MDSAYVSHLKSRRAVIFECMEWVLAADQTIGRLHKKRVLEDIDLLLYWSLRPTVGLTQAELAEMFGVSQSWVSKRIDFIRRVLMVEGFPGLLGSAEETRVIDVTPSVEADLGSGARPS